MDMSAGWDLFVERGDFAATLIAETPVPEPGDGEAVLRCDRVGVTANNVTYAIVGDSMRYWQFFPASGTLGRVPLWGFADVASSTIEGLAEGTRVYGYLPPSSHLVVRPDRVDSHGFRDASLHRAALPGPYNIYQAVLSDPAYDAEREDLQVLYRPLFITSFMLDDFFADNEDFGAEQLILSSASSKTAYGTAFCARLRRSAPRLVGLTSDRNRAFTESLGCYDEVWTYDELEAQPADVPTAYADMAGNLDLRKRIHGHFGDALRHDAVVGATHLAAAPGAGAADVPGPRPTFFFAPDQITKRRADWGPRGVEAKFGAAWAAFVPAVETWVDVAAGQGPEGLRAAWLEVLSGQSSPRVGHVVQL